MERQGRGSGSRQRKIQVLDISNHLHTLIRLRYAGDLVASPPKPGLPARIDNTEPWSNQHFPIKPSTMNEEAIWRRWRSNMEKFTGDETNKMTECTGSARKRTVGFAFGQIQSNSYNSPKNHQAKQSSGNISVLNYNMYNGMSMGQQTSINNDRKRNMSNEPYVPKTNVCNSFKDYCDHCTIHGLKYVGDSSLPGFERVFWIFSFLLAIFGAAYFIWNLYTKFTYSPIIISRNSDMVAIDQIPFPALTVCNMNNAKKSIAQGIIKGNDSLHKFLLADVCDTKNDTIVGDATEESREWEHVEQFWKMISQNCSDMLHYCQWHGNSTNCTDIFNAVFTDEGLCCKFNSVHRVLHDGKLWDFDIAIGAEKDVDWNPEYVFKASDPPNSIPWRAYGSGADIGLTLSLDVEADEYYCSSTVSVGFKMQLHSPVETPQIRDFAFTLSPGKETRVIITPHITDADMSIRNIPPKTRRCYFLNEKPLKYFRTYTQRNCILECEANYTLSMCQCMEYYMPVASGTKICGKSDEECAEKTKKAMRTKLNDEEDIFLQGKKAPSCKCYPGCYEINYSTEISQSMLMTTFDIPEEYIKHNKSYFQKNIAVVHIFFIDTSYMKYTKNELYGFAELLSNTGGLLGLFMGFSLLSVVEIVYYFTIRLWWRLWKSKLKKTDKNKNIFQQFGKKDAVYPFSQ